MLITKNEIHLWYVDDRQITKKSLIDEYHCLLTKEERLKKERFHFEKHKHQYLMTRALVKNVLSFYEQDICPEQWAFSHNDYGKPFIANDIALPLMFNISHTEGMVVLAVTLEADVGVDVEWLGRHGSDVDIAESFFSKKENIELFALPVEHQKERFFELWTLKEAYIKACGLGLSIPLDSFSFSFLHNGEISIEFDNTRKDKKENWFFRQMPLKSGYKMALAVNREGGNAFFYDVKIKEMCPEINFNRQAANSDQ